MAKHIHIHIGKTKDASFPGSVSYKGQKFVPTGKTGKTANGEESREYRLPDERVWVTASGKVIPD